MLILKHLSLAWGSKYSAALKIRGDTVEEGEWDEVVVVHSASFEHFADMLGGSDYQEINRRLKMGSLRIRVIC